MPYTTANRVQETTSTSGTGTLTLNGAVAGFKNFNNGIGIGNTTSYVIFDPTANVWEAGIGTLLTANTFGRTQVLSNSSNTTALINFAGNTSNVWCDYLTEKSVTQFDVGTDANQIPLNQYLGTMAWQDAKAVRLGGDAVINTLTVGLGSGSVATNTATGYQALNANTTGAYNASYGYQASFKNTTGNYNASYGYNALYNNLIGASNSAFGYQSLLSCTGNYNTAFGYNSLVFTSSGANNVGIGYQTMQTNTTGGLNTAVGSGALFANNTNNNNVALGYQALRNTIANGNTGLGYSAGSTLTTGANNLVIGNNAQASSATVSNEITIGNNTQTVIRYPLSYSTVATLPSAATVGQGSRTFVTDALAPVFQATVTGGGAVFTPVYSDGTNWKVG